MEQGIEALLRGARDVDAALDNPGLDPNPARTDWSAERERIQQLQSELNDRVLRPLPEVEGQLASEDRSALRHLVARIAAEMAALLSASKAAGARSLLLEAVGLAGTAELRAAQADFDNFLLLVRGRWLIRHNQNSEGEKLLRQVQAGSSQTALKDAAKAAINGPRPITAAPPMFTLNGCGVRLYGNRDAQPNGSHVATYCITFLFVPIFPLGAYRVIEHGGGSYSFLSKERLSPFARGFRAVALVAALLFGSAAIVNAYLESPGYQAGQHFEAAQALEKSGEVERAIEAYREVAALYPSSDQSPAAADAALRLRLLQVSEPLRSDSLDQAESALAYFRGLGRPEGPASERMTMALQRWLGQVEGQDAAAQVARLRLLDAGLESAPYGQRQALAAQKLTVTLQLVDGLIESRPLDALGLLNDLPWDEGVNLRSARIVAGLVDQPALLYFCRAEISQWLSRALAPESGQLHERVQAAFEQAQARATDESRAKLLETGDIKALSRRLRETPNDQELAWVLAAQLRHLGDAAGAEKLLASMGGEGRMIPNAVQLWASLDIDAGRLKDALSKLDGLLLLRLPRYARARQLYEAGARRIQEQLVSKARLGQLPSELQRKLNTASDAAGKQMFQDWLYGELSSSAELGALRERLAEQEFVVPAALSLGMVRLRLANQQSGAERDRLLNEAAQAFLSIRDQAQELPSFHLGLGQIYHRLGRSEEGEAELAKVVASDDPELLLAVAGVYRDLGMTGRAREIAENGVFNKAAEPQRSNAAELMALMSRSLKERERWLTRASAEVLPWIKTSLTEARAYRLLSEGQLPAADKAFAEVEGFYAKAAKTDPVSSNNMAVAAQNRYECTGDVKHLSRAAGALEASLRLAPDRALTVQNLTDVLAARGTLEVLSPWIHIQTLRLGSSDVGALLAQLSSSSLRGSVIERSRAHRDLNRALELNRQSQVLAPGSPRAYLGEAMLLAWQRDVPAIEALRARASQVKSIDHTIEEDSKAVLKDPVMIAEALELASAELESWKKRVELARRDGHPATLAVALWFEANALGERVALNNQIEDARASVALLEEAQAIWPELAADSALATALVRVALLDEKARSQALEQVWERDRRNYSAFMVAVRALEGSDGAVISSALRANPDFSRAIEIERGLNSEQLGASSCLLARAIGDADLEKKARGSPGLPTEWAVAELSALLFPGHEPTQDRLNRVRALHLPLP